MRIVCQKCAAAYAIDDRLAASQGVRAQCPRCRHIQRARREDALPLPSSAAATVPAMPRVVPPRAAPGAASRRGAALSMRDPDDVEPVVTGSAEVEIDDRLLTPRGAPAEKCRNCGVRLEDAFDRALGVCGRCSVKTLDDDDRGEVTEVTATAGLSSNERTVVVPMPTAPPVPTPPPAPAPPLALFDPMPSSPGVAAPSKPAPLITSLPLGFPIEAEATMEAPIPEGGFTGEHAMGPAPRGEITDVKSPVLSQRSLMIAGFIFAAVLVVGVLGVIVYQRKEAAERARVAIPSAVVNAISRWKLTLDDVEGESSAFLAEGGSQLALDTPQGYALAAGAFQKALMLDPRSDEAIAGYVQSLALGWTDGLDATTYDEALALIGAAEGRSKRDASSLVAHANLLLTRGSRKELAEKARALADEALTRAKGLDRAEALVVKGRVLLASSPLGSSQALEEALTLPEAPKRAHFYRAMAHRALGEYRAALEQLQRRLAIDPAHLETLTLVARIYEEVGEPALARDAYMKAQEKAPKVAQIKVALAALRYRALAQPAQAIEVLKGVAKDPALESEVRRDALVHLAAAHRASGKLDAAQAAAQEALALDPSWAPAHLQAFLAALEAKAPQAAEPHLAPLHGRLGDEALELLLRGRLAVAEERYPDAVTLFVKAHAADGRRVDALLWAGAASASAGEKEEAFRLLAQALGSDPSATGPLPFDARLYVTSEDLLSGIENRVAKLAAPQEPSARLYEGLIRFHGADLAEADGWLKQALAMEDGNAAARALRALIALARNDRGSARALADRAVKADRQLALAQYALGQALLAAGDLDGAGKALGEAQALAPTLLAADVALAELDVKAKRLDEARKRLTRVVGLDPSYLPAKKALYALAP